MGAPLTLIALAVCAQQEGSLLMKKNERVSFIRTYFFEDFLKNFTNERIIEL